MQEERRTSAGSTLFSSGLKTAFTMCRTDQCGRESSCCLSEAGEKKINSQLNSFFNLIVSYGWYQRDSKILYDECISSVVLVLTSCFMEFHTSPPQTSTAVVGGTKLERENLSKARKQKNESPPELCGPAVYFIPKSIRHRNGAPAYSNVCGLTDL